MAPPNRVRGAIHSCSPRVYMILVFKSFPMFIPQVWDLLKFCKCPQHEENSGFLLHSFAKHFQSLVFALVTFTHTQQVLLVPPPKELLDSNPSCSLQLPGPYCTPGHLCLQPGVLFKMLAFHCFLTDMWNQIITTSFQGLGGPVI